MALLPSPIIQNFESFSKQLTPNAIFNHLHKALSNTDSKNVYINKTSFKSRNIQNIIITV